MVFFFLRFLISLWSFGKVSRKELRVQAWKALLGLLANGEVETHTEVVKNSDGEVISIKQKQVKKPCPKWVVDKVLGADMHELEAIKVLVESKMLPDELIGELAEVIEKTMDDLKTAFKKGTSSEDETY